MCQRLSHRGAYALGDLDEGNACRMLMLLFNSGWFA